MKKVIRAWIVLGIVMAVTAGCGTGAEAGGTARNESEVSEAAETTIEETEPETEATPSWESYRKVPNPVAADGSRILFVGNSHTYVNDVPGLFYQLALAAGHEVDVVEISQGMYSLKQFADPEDEMGEIMQTALTEETWDFVILQEKTASALSGYAETEMYPSARDLDERIKAAGGQTAFMMTWPMKDGAGTFSRESIYNMLSEGYRQIAEELDAVLIPGGEVLMEVLEQNPDLELWGDDGQHMSEAGAYMAACTAYAVLFQETPVGNSFLGGLDEDVAASLQQAAAKMALE
ncbi:MAG: DUF4886 domain-containing protein [Lachnospiraceae bacterium]